MTLVDINLLIYATFRDALEHQLARAWLEGQLSLVAGAIVLCWPVLYAFVRLISSRSVFGEQAISVHRRWTVAQHRGQPGVRLVAPEAGHQPIAMELA